MGAFCFQSIIERAEEMLRQTKFITFLLIFAAVYVFHASLSCSDIHAAGMQDDVDQAITILERFQEIPEKSIPPAVLKNAKGLSILTAPVQ